MPVGDLYATLEELSSDMSWESQLLFPIAHTQPLWLTHFAYCDRAVELASPYLAILVEDTE